MKKTVYIVIAGLVFLNICSCQPVNGKEDSSLNKNTSSVEAISSEPSNSNNESEPIESVIPPEGLTISQYLERESVGIHFAGEQKNRTLKVGEVQYSRPILSPRISGVTFYYKAKCDPEGIVEFKQVQPGMKNFSLTAKKVGTCKVTVTVTSPMKEGSATDDFTVTVTE